MICSYRSTLARRETYRVKNLLTPINAEHSLKVARTGECSFVFHQHWVSNHLPLVYKFADMHTIESITVSTEPSAKMRDEVFAKVAAIVRKTLPIQVQLLRLLKNMNQNSAISRSRMKIWSQASGVLMHLK